MNWTALVLAAVVGGQPEPPVDFDTQIVPVLTRSGCNAGSCHGAAAGRGGFHLSLLGGDPSFDYRSIVVELEGRRINLARPEESLLLAKPTEALEHGGGLRLEWEGPGFELLREWIAQGGQRIEARSLVQLDVSPDSILVERPDTEVPLRAIARFDDGLQQDVTRWVVFRATDPASVEIDDTRGVAVPRRPGQHTIVARYLDRVMPVTLIVPRENGPVDVPLAENAGPIDRYVAQMLEQLRLAPSPPADPASFLRRLRLDLTGRLPAPDEVRAYLADPSEDNKARWIDRLLASEDFTEYWTFRLAQLLQLRSVGGDLAGAEAMHGWIEAQLRDGVGFDQIARELLCAVGDTHQVGPAYFARLSANAREEAELISRALMGVRLECANCHDHPLDRWTQDDYHGLAAIFARLDRGKIVRVTPRGAVTHPRTGEPATPRLPATCDLDGEGDHRQAFAAWLVDPDNPWFARAIANRLWQAMFGRGLVDPVDDLRDTNPATHPRLLAELSDDFVRHGYDVRYTLRQIALSQTYARGPATAANASDTQFLSHALVRPLAPEVLLDAIADVTGVPERFEGQLPGTRAIELVVPEIPSEALDVLGRCRRDASCASSEGAAGGLAAMLYRINGPLIQARLTAPEGRLGRMLAENKSDGEILEEFYLAALGRYPSEPEIRYWRSEVRYEDPGQRVAWLEDAIWSLLVSREFMTNH